MNLFLSLLPIIVILIMLIALKKSADISGIVGLIVVSGLAYFFFDTSFGVLGRSIISGLIKSFPVSLIVAMSLLQMAYMEKTGALKRIIIFMKTISSENKAAQIMMINIGFGTLMVAVGATPVSLLPPILIAMGYSTYVAIALPSIGYDSLCTYALLGAPIVVFVDITNGFLLQNPIGNIHQISLHQAGSVFAMFLPLVSTMIGFSMLWIVGKWKAIKTGWIPCLITGAVIGIVSFFTNKIDNLVALTGVMCGIAVIIVMAIYLKATGKKVIDRSLLTKEELEYEKKYPLWKAISPWVLLIVIILALNIPKSIFDELYRNRLFAITGLSADGKSIPTRLLWNAYTWILASTILSMIILRPSAKNIKETLNVWLKRAPRPVFSAAIFFAIGEVMNMSGFNIASQKFTHSSMVQVLADSSSKFFGHAYGGIVAFIGLLGGFITGSEASTVAMFSGYSMSTAKNLNMDLRSLLIISAAVAFGGGLASVISPAKLQNAAASIDKLGEENQVIRVAFVFSLLLTLATSIFVIIIL
jgi:lactate permease